MASAPPKRKAASGGGGGEDDEGRARKSARATDAKDDPAEAAAKPSGRQPRQLRVKLTGANTCTRQLQVNCARQRSYFFPSRARATVDG